MICRYVGNTIHSYHIFSHLGLFHVEHYPLTLLGNDSDLLIKTDIDNSKFGLENTSKAGLSIQNHEYHSSSTVIPMVFPGEWVKSCLALSMQTDSIKWVLDGILALNVTSDTLKKAVDNAPTDLTGKIIIGRQKNLATGNQRIAKWQA